MRQINVCGRNRCLGISRRTYILSKSVLVGAGTDGQAAHELRSVLAQERFQINQGGAEHLKRMPAIHGLDWEFVTEQH